MPRADAPAVPGLLRPVVAGLLALLLLLAGCSSAPTSEVDDDQDRAAPETLTPDTADPPDDLSEPEPGPERAEPVEEPPPPPVPESRAALVARLQPLVDAAAEQVGSGALAVLVTDEHGREVVAHAPDTPVIPASTMKTITAAAVLTTLGPDARLTTLIESTAPIDGRGTLSGDLAILGVGDPALATDLYGRWIYPARPRTPFESLADQLVEHGLARLEGDVVGVADTFTGEPRAEGWRDRYFSDFDARYTAGLTVDAGLVTLMRYPELEAELAAARERLADDADEIDPADLEGLSDLAGRDLDDPAEIDLADVDLADVDPQDLAEWLGLDDPGPPEVRVELATDPAQHAAAELIRLLVDRGVEVEGEARSGPAPEPVVGRLASVTSPPLEELLRFTMKRSDNHMGDQLFQVIGRVRTGEGSWQRGERAVRQVLDHLGVDHTHARFADGSGLSREAQVTARLLVDVDRAMADSRHGEVWLSLMAVMGEDGTLRQRLVGTPAQGRFFGKTGTLDDVTALGGAVTGDDGGRYHLAIIANGPADGRWGARALMDEVVLALVADLEDCALAPAANADDGPLGIPPSVVAC